VQGRAGDEVTDADGPAPLITFGHGTATRERMAALLHGAEVPAVVDVRTAPGSRRNPDAGKSALEQWMPREGLAYRWEPRLGGFRTAAPDSPDTFWENASFRGYAGYTRDPRFVAAMDDLLQQAAPVRTAVMCAETVWWRCHRRMIADFAVLARGSAVLHLAHDGRLTGHRPTAGARLRGDGLLVYDQH
jgi:uncharacterized protein (DUF488 family)